MKDGFPVSIAELLAAGQRPLPSEAVAIVLDVCRQVMRQRAGASVLPPISTGALFLDASGTVSVAGGVPAEDDQTVPLLARLLLQMLPVSGTPGGARVPSRLRQLASRAAAAESPRLTVARLAVGLRRFAPEQPQAAIRGLFERWCGKQDPVAGWPPMLEARGPEPVETAAPALSRRSAGSRRRRMAAVGIIAAAFLILLGVGATYWLNADEGLPPLPMNPAIFIKDPPAPARGGWELLADPAGLAVDGGTRIVLPTENLLGSSSASDAGRRRAATGELSSKGRLQLDAPFAHGPDH